MQQKFTHVLTDYELMLLDLVPEAGLTWRGNPNELNAGTSLCGLHQVTTSQVILILK
jgi:pyruvate decarboxylase